MSSKRPNLVYIFADQMRAQATGYAGDPNVSTPVLDALSAESINVELAVSNCPICTPYRASLMTGQYPLSHGLFMNDQNIPSASPSLARSLEGAGYRTAYVGKWHLSGKGRSAYIPPEDRHGFTQHWKVLECTHSYFDSYYYEGEDPERKQWSGYDAFAQSKDVVSWIEQVPEDKPFALFLSYGPPHDPYDQVPGNYVSKYAGMDFKLRDNVHPELVEMAKKELEGYYAHITALDDAISWVDEALIKRGMKEDTIFIFTSDHGDSIESQCVPGNTTIHKQRPYDESVLVPFLLRWPSRFGSQARRVKEALATPDIMPTLLSLCGVDIPERVEGVDFTPALEGGTMDRDGVLLASYSPFADWRSARGGRAYRGIRTQRYTYIKHLEGAWMLFDNVEDPYQTQNLAGDAGYAEVERDLDGELQKILEEQGDEFLEPSLLRKKYRILEIDKHDAIPYEQ